MEQFLGSIRRVAFFGGSFDPPHEGHLAVARAAQRALSLDLVLFAPVGAQPLKPLGSTASFEDRVEMTRLAIAGSSGAGSGGVGQAGFEVSLLDAPRPDAAPNYTIDTLLELRAGLPADTALFCLMGADSFFGLRQWHRAAEIPFMASLIVAARPGQPFDDLKAALPRSLTIEFLSGRDDLAVREQIELCACVLRNPAGETASLYLLPALHIEISASQLREQIQSEGAPGNRQSQVLPAAVLNYIRSHELYRQAF
jgi:nicotinate-nucleotide adenylyltransferase